MENEIYIKTLEAARTEVAQLTRQREEIDEKLRKLAPIVEYLSFLCEKPEDSQVLELAQNDQEGVESGLTGAIRMAMRRAGVWLTPVQVRDAVKSIGFDLSHYASVMPPIHNTLERMFLNDEIEKGQNESGDKAYRWVNEVTRALSQQRNAKRRAFIGRSPGAPRSIDQTSDEMLNAQASTRKKI